VKILPLWFTVAVPSNNSVQLPEGPFTATNYSGTQMNFWGVAPSSVPAWLNASPYDTPTQLGAVTNSVLQVWCLFSAEYG